MAKRNQGRNRRRKARVDVFEMMTSAREASKIALRHLRKEINAARKLLEKLLGEEKSFTLDLFGASGSGRGRKAGRPRKRGRPMASGATARKARRSRKGPPKADKYFATLPNQFTIDDVRKVAGKATGVSLAQWARAKKEKKTAAGYEKTD